MAASEEGDVLLLSQPYQNQEGSRGLHSLSNEIIIRIVENVSDAQSLLSLALCSRQLYLLTEAALYAHFQQINSKSLPTFLCRLLARPDLACRVKMFTGASSHSGREDQDVSSLTAEDWTRVKAAVEAARTTEEQEVRWVEAIELGLWDALVALFLCVTPNLEEIELEDWEYSYTGEPLFIDDVMERAADLQNRGEESLFSLLRLKSVSLTYGDAESGMLFSELELFLKLKSVADCKAFAVYEDNDDEYESAPSPPFIYWTKRLTLMHPVINHIDMSYRFRAFKCLESLYYELGPATVDCTGIEPPRIMQAIEHLKPCLRDLTILVGQVDQTWGAEFEGYPIGSLVGFEKLTSVAVNSFILIGKDPEEEDDDEEDEKEDEDGGSANAKEFPSHQRLSDSLPPTLTSLSLHDIQEHHISHIYTLLSQKASHIPQLTRLNLQWLGVTYPDKSSPKTPIWHRPFTEEQVDEIMALCDAVGVELVMEYPPPRVKFVSYVQLLSKEEQSTFVGGGRPMGVEAPSVITNVKVFDYPYDGFDAFCAEHGIDPGSATPWPVD